jgi:hypothetical protein
MEMTCEHRWLKISLAPFLGYTTPATVDTRTMGWFKMQRVEMATSEALAVVSSPGGWLVVVVVVVVVTEPQRRLRVCRT